MKCILQFILNMNTNMNWKILGNTSRNEHVERHGLRIQVNKMYILKCLNSSAAFVGRIKFKEIKSKQTLILFEMQLIRNISTQYCRKKFIS